MAYYRAPQEFEDWFDWLSAGLHARSQSRLAPLLMGVLFAGGRRVVASWIRTAKVSDDYQDYYYFLQSVGKRWQELGRILVSPRPYGHFHAVTAISTFPFKIGNDSSWCRAHIRKPSILGARFRPTRAVPADGLGMSSNG